jgi:hypothetical protein
MALNYDLQLQDNDLYIDPLAGDFVIVPSDEQHIADNLTAFAGWWKENPADGVGILQFANSSGQEQAIQRLIKYNLQQDGYQTDTPLITRAANGTLTINPNATKL